MSIQKTYSPKLIDAPTAEQKQQAHQLHQDILSTITEVKASESNLEHNYIKLGRLILEVQTNQYWIILGYTSNKDYMEFLMDRFGKGRTQLYGYVSIAKALLPSVSEEDLEEMGVSKAGELKRAVVATGKAPSDELVEMATNSKVTAPEFREAVHKEFHIFDEKEKGSWFDLGGVYFTPDEKEEFLRSVEKAKHTDPAIEHTLPAHAQMKEVLIRFAQEYWAQYGYQTEGSVSGFNEVYEQANQFGKCYE